jgi:hypothetical protein
MKSERKEVYPLSWPEDEPRTRPQDRKQRKSWKCTATQYRDKLQDELTRMGAESFIISSNVQVSERGSMVKGLEPLDVGVAVYFSMNVKEDFAWQDVFNVHDPAPTEEQIDAAYRPLASKYHPDNPQTGDRAMFETLTRHRVNAKRWINRKTNQDFSHVIACDAFNEVRLNMAAIVGTIQAIRKIEQCGTSRMLERAFKGFAAIAENASVATTS